MDFSHSDKVRLLQDQVAGFMDAHVYPARRASMRRWKKTVSPATRWQPTAIMEELKRKARAQNLWNLFLPHSSTVPVFSNLEYAPLSRDHGTLASRARGFNCSAPDTAQHGSAGPLCHAETTAPLAGARCSRAESARPFAMTEPDVASSDATNIKSSIVRDGASLRDQWTQVVDFGRRRSTLRDTDIPWVRPIRRRGFTASSP